MQLHLGKKRPPTLIPLPGEKVYRLRSAGQKLVCSNDAIRWGPRSDTASVLVKRNIRAPHFPDPHPACMKSWVGALQLQDGGSQAEEAVSQETSLSTMAPKGLTTYGTSFSLFLVRPAQSIKTSLQAPIPFLSWLQNPVWICWNKLLCLTKETRRISESEQDWPTIPLCIRQSKHRTLSSYLRLVSWCSQGTGVLLGVCSLYWSHKKAVF